MAIRTLIVEDEAEVAFALRTIFENRRGFVVSGVYHSLSKTLQAAKEADVAIVDIKLPDGSGADLIPVLREKFPQMKILVYTATEDNSMLLSTIAQGASGYLLKGMPIEDLFDNIKVVASGGFTLSKAMAVEILGLHKKSPEADILSGRETDVLRHLALGFTSGEIADALQLSAATVRKHLENIYRKLQVKSRSGAILFAIKSGIIRKP